MGRRSVALAVLFLLLRSLGFVILSWKFAFPRLLCNLFTSPWHLPSETPQLRAADKPQGGQTPQAERARGGTLSGPGVRIARRRLHLTWRAQRLKPARWKALRARLSSIILLTRGVW